MFLLMARCLLKYKAWRILVLALYILILLMRLENFGTAAMESSETMLITSMSSKRLNPWECWGDLVIASIDLA